jgi:ankyrin repeat protein
MAAPPITRAVAAVVPLLGALALGCSRQAGPKQAAQTSAPRPAAERGADVKQRDEDGQTPLLAAVRRGRSEEVKRLLARGADANDEVYPWSALRLAAFVGDDASVALLLERGARIDAPSDHGLTALMYAAGRGHAAVVRALLARGAAVEARDRGGHTPLMFAANGGHLDVAQALLEAGSDRAAKNRAGETAARLAEANGHAAVVVALSQRREGAPKRTAEAARSRT